MKGIKEVIHERGRNYGNYTNGIKVRRHLVEIIKANYLAENGQHMPETQQEYFWDICNKLSRLSVTPTHEDSWTDIIGYTTRILQEIQK